VRNVACYCIIASIVVPLTARLYLKFCVVAPVYVNVNVPGVNVKPLFGTSNVGIIVPEVNATGEAAFKLIEPEVALACAYERTP